MLNKLSYNIASSLNESEQFKESKDWTPDEIKKASEAMKKQGHLGYEEFTKEWEKKSKSINEDEIDNSRRASNFINDIIHGEEIYLRDVNGQALLIRYAEGYPEPEEYDEGYLEVNGGNPEDLARAKEAAENREVWEIIEVDESGEPSGTLLAYVYGEAELPAYLDGLRQVNIVKRLEESNINNMEIDEMIKEYATMCDNAGMSTFEVLDNLLKYDVLNTGSFRNMLQDLNNYLEDNK